MTILSILFLILIIPGGLYALFSLLCVLGFFKGPGGLRKNLSPTDRELPAVSVLKAIKGLDSSCAENLSSFCAQDYPRYEVLFGFRDLDDPATPVAEAIAASATCDARVVVKHEGSGTNQKALNLKVLSDESRYPMLALSDSDMVVDTHYLRQIVAEFQDNGKAGIVTSLYKISNPASVGSALESLNIALDFIPSVLTARRLEGVTFGLGASILISKEALRDIGGFEAVADYLADDYQLGFRLWKKGYTNIISRYVIENRVGPMSVANHLNHQLRWARTYRASRPLGFLGYGITHIFAFALLFFCIRPSAASALTAAIVLAFRYTLALVMYKKVIKTKGWLKTLFLLPLKDVLSFLVWVWSFAGSTVTWRGSRYRVIPGGKMVKE
jgi:ceramide glucosyltransferase